MENKKVEKLKKLLKNDPQFRGWIIAEIESNLTEYQKGQLKALEIVEGYEVGFVDFFAFAFGDTSYDCDFYDCIINYIECFEIEFNIGDLEELDY